MYMNEQAILRSRYGEPMPLLSVSAKGTLAGVLLELTVEQRYKNPKETNIEAVYTFPLASDAVLLGIEFEINGNILSGTAIEKITASQRYENAIESGDSAILLEKSGDGLYTVNLGNLMANEEAVVRYRYGQVLTWQQGNLRLTIPTTIAPRYGSPEQDGMQPHQVPESDLTIEYPFTLEIDVLGDLATCPISCPTHVLDTFAIETGQRIRLTQARLDRDVVLNIDGVNHSVVHIAQDQDQWVALASFCPQIEGIAASSPLSLRIVIDCSGSMEGDSIHAARQGAISVVESLRTEDEFSLTRFGTEVEHLMERLVPASQDAVTQTRHRLMGLEADMGGTEMEDALNSVAKLAAKLEGGTVLLITDGEIHGVDSLIQSAYLSGLRYFVVGVGSSPFHSTLSRLASETGGGYEAVVPGEDVEKAILRQFGRMRQPRAAELKMSWPVQATWTTELPKSLFQGDTLHSFTGFAEAPSGMADLCYTLADGTIRKESACIESWPANAKTLAKLAAATRIRQGRGDEADQEREFTDMAVHYNLVSDYTHYLVIHERAEGEKADDLPELAKVRQMLAAGWGGAGTVQSHCYTVNSELQPDSDNVRSCLRMHSAREVVEQDMHLLAHMQSTRRMLWSTPALFDNFISNLDKRLNAWSRGGMVTQTSLLKKLIRVWRQEKQSDDMVTKVSELKELGVPPAVCFILDSMVDEGYDEVRVILAFFKVMKNEGKLAGLSASGMVKIDRAILADKPWPILRLGPRVQSSLDSLTDEDIRYWESHYSDPTT